MYKNLFPIVTISCHWCGKKVSMNTSTYRAKEKRALKTHAHYVFNCSRTCAQQYLFRVVKRVSNHHGTQTRYHSGCRCRLCTTAQTLAMREYKKKHPRRKKGEMSVMLVKAPGHRACMKCKKLIEPGEDCALLDERLYSHINCSTEAKKRVKQVKLHQGEL